LPNDDPKQRRCERRSTRRALAAPRPRCAPTRGLSLTPVRARSLRRPDITIARELIKWEPQVQLEDGLKKTIEYFAKVDMRTFKKPTQHDAHMNSDADKDSKKRKTV
jgi:hypothetical protein